VQHFPAIVQSYCGQSQQRVINTPAIPWEDGPGVIPPYANLFPQAQTAWMAPALTGTDLWKAMQLWPLPQSG